MTDCTLKEMWHRVHRFGFVLQVHNFKLLPPRSRDRWIMQAFIDAGYSLADLLILNLVRQHQQVLFVSDVFSADGRKLDEKYLLRRPRDETWSTLIFPVQHLQPGHFRLWKSALRRISHPANMIDSLGKFGHDGHKIWEWRYDRLNERVLRQNGDLVEVFVSAAATARSTGRNRIYHFSHAASVDLSGHDICTITPVSNTSLKVASHAKDSN